MYSVVEQLQKYRAMNARNRSTIQHYHPHAVACRHPNTNDYFKALMLRWQDQGTQDSPLAPAHTK